MQSNKARNVSACVNFSLANVFFYKTYAIMYSMFTVSNQSFYLSYTLKMSELFYCNLFNGTFLERSRIVNAFLEKLFSTAN